MNRCQTIIFVADEKDTTRQLLFTKVAQQLKLLLEAGYVAIVKYDEPNMGIVVIEFEHDERFESWGVCSPVWVTEDEEWAILHDVCGAQGTD